MPLADLTFHRWRSFDHHAATRYAHEAARKVGGLVVEVRAVEHLGAAFQRAVIEQGSRQFALVPGGDVTVGLDLERWQPTPEQLECYQAETLTGGFGFTADVRDYLAEVLSPLRTVTVPTMLVALEPETLTAAFADMPALLAERGLRLPSPDEWEHACGAGARTLFRWGDQCPLDRSPYEATDGPQHQRNVLGLRIAYDTYRAELTSDPSAVHGGDGGEAECGGYGTFVAWLPLATANRNPAMAEFLHGEDGESMYEDLSTRPVLELN
ncbi:hypothetical protein C7C46_01585 [Streptomyces tateyamensis]|uniref:Sulfatase-modifying factor enzyme domain-containing protein n=1 Tax=Streptomyces tateyamensis TaxID=565073 RepID=A0A2V4P0G0_9ACTN|nr:hypothetical protein [Streptomyces tateyamensis]PYC88070.1 hypothetical protein C7C46_01585 [Streptomyces tateyamensis]